MNLRAVSTEDPELSERFDRVLQGVVDAFDRFSIPYLFIGGVASGGLGRPRSTSDIDVFVRPEDRERALRALDASGFEIQRTDPVWLYKAFKENILVDVIFKSKGEIYLDAAMFARMTEAEFHGKKLRLASPEDLILIKALAHSEATPGHWHDALALLSHAEIDWNYLLLRARKAPRRVLSLLLYAQSNDLWVPDAVVSRLYQDIFGARIEMPEGRAGPAQGSAIARKFIHASEKRQQECRIRYEIERLKERIARDEHLGQLDVEILGNAGERETRILLRGETMSEEAWHELSRIAREHFPGSIIDNQVRVIDTGVA